MRYIVLILLTLFNLGLTVFLIYDFSIQKLLTFILSILALVKYVLYLRKSG